MTISNPEIKKLYGLSAGRCNICKINLFENEVHIGEMAHIIARSFRGPRGEELLNVERNSYDNLILLCANHHIEVDQNPRRYPIDKLHEVKIQHEKNVASLFDSPHERKNDVTFLNLFMEFVPFTQLQTLIEHLPSSVKINFSLVGDMFEALCKDNPHLYPFNEATLQEKFDRFIQSYYFLWNEIEGYTDVNGQEQAHFSQADDYGYLHMEKRYLPYEKRIALTKKIEDLKSQFLYTYFDLINFLRINYKDIRLKQ